MPKDAPSAAELWEGGVTFFSIDTDLIQSAGYDFTAGALNKLPAQLPVAMSLQLSEVVVQEIIKHRMEPVLGAVAQFKSATEALRRTAGLQLAAVVTSFEELKAEAQGAATFRKEVEDYAARCRGGVLDLNMDNLAAQMFERYFATKPPFALRKDKKSEFPDAATLLILENHARANNTKGIFASRDGGSSAFAADSEHLYCVKSIEDLAALFVATSEHAAAIKNRVVEALADENSSLRDQLLDAINQHVVDAQWDVGDIYSGSVQRVEGEANDVELKSYQIDTEQVEIWESKDVAGAWIIEASATAQVWVTVDVTFYVWDSFDKEEFELDTQSVEVPMSIDLSAFLTCAAITIENTQDDWSVDVEIAAGNYSVDVGEVNPEFDPD